MADVEVVLTPKQKKDGDKSLYSHVPPGFADAADGSVLTKKDDETMEWKEAAPTAGYTGTIVTAADGTFDFADGLLVIYTPPA